MALRPETIDVIGTAAAPVTLTANYSDNVSAKFGTSNSVQNHLFVFYTRGQAGNSIQVIVKYAAPLSKVSNLTLASNSPEWAQEVGAVYSGGTTTLQYNTYTFTATAATDAFPIEIPGGYRFMQVSVKETSGGAFGTCNIRLERIESEVIR